MGKTNYCYVIVDKDNGSMLIEDGKLPFYWNKKVAKERCYWFSKHCVRKIKLEEINDLIESLDDIDESYFKSN